MAGFLLVLIYLSFISLGLPDAMLGSAWPIMHPLLNVPVSYMGLISVTLSLCTVVSSLMADRINRRFGTALVTAASTAMTALALVGISFCNEFWQMWLFAVPLGLGAGSVDTALNNYVAIHYQSRHMSWLHCMWGVGASIGPAIMGLTLTSHMEWSNGFLCAGFIQGTLAVVLFATMGLWKRGTSESAPGAGESLSIRKTLEIPGARELMIYFFCYCALEQTAGQWASTYYVHRFTIPAEEAAGFASWFYLGMTVGRGASGFLTMKFNDEQMIRLGQTLIVLGIGIMFLPLGICAGVAGLLLVGLGCAPIFPCTIHATPSRFGEDRSQALIGLQISFANAGICAMPPVFGIVVRYFGGQLLPVYLIGLLGIMVLLSRRVNGIFRKNLAISDHS